MTRPSVDLVAKDVMTAVADWLGGIFPEGMPIVQGQANRVAPPAFKNPADPRQDFRPPEWYQLTQVGLERLGANCERIASGMRGITSTNIFSVQVDIFGKEADRYAQILQTMARDWDSLGEFPAGIRPLYADNPKQLPIINDAGQWERRWTVTLAVQFDPTLTLPADTLTTATIVPIPADVLIL